MPTYLYDLRPICQPIVHGWIQNACYTFSTIDAYNVARVTSGLAPQPLSYEWLYYRNQQTQERSAQRVLSLIGALATWDGISPPSDDDAAAAAHRMTCRFPVAPYTGPPWRPYHAAILQALSAGIAPLWQGVLTHDWDNPGTSIIPAAAPGQVVYVAHAVTIVGYDAVNDAYLIRNMWGSGWGDGGYARVSADYLAYLGNNVVSFGDLAIPDAIIDNGVTTFVPTAAAGNTVVQGAGAAAGVAAGTWVGRAAKPMAGAAVGTGTGSAVGTFVKTGRGAAAGAAVASGVGAKLASGVGASSGVAVALAAYAPSGVGSSAGTSTASASPLTASVAAAAGIAAASAAGMLLGNAVGAAAGTSAAAAVGRFGFADLPAAETDTVRLVHVVPAASFGHATDDASAQTVYARSTGDATATFVGEEKRRARGVAAGAGAAAAHSDLAEGVESTGAADATLASVWKAAEISAGAATDEIEVTHRRYVVAAAAGAASVSAFAVGGGAGVGAAAGAAIAAARGQTTTAGAASGAASVLGVGGAVFSAVALAVGAAGAAAATARNRQEETLESVGFAEGLVLLSIPAVYPIFWSNTGAGAAATWEGLPFNSVVEVDGVVYAAGVEGVFQMDDTGDDDGEDVLSNIEYDLKELDPKSDYKTRMRSIYINAQADAPFTVRVSNKQGIFEYETHLPSSTKMTNHRAPFGRGLSARVMRMNLEQSRYFSVADANVEVGDTTRRV
jgi:hypothetical protein